MQVCLPPCGIYVYNVFVICRTSWLGKTYPGVHHMKNMLGIHPTFLTFLLLPFIRRSIFMLFLANFQTFTNVLVDLLVLHTIQMMLLPFCSLRMIPVKSLLVPSSELLIVIRTCVLLPLRGGLRNRISLLIQPPPEHNHPSCTVLGPH